jgi:hypothetical protein
MATPSAFGDAFIVQTPTLDRWGQQLYAEQKLREQRQMQENTALDNQLRTELGKVRSVDTPDIINSYTKYKELKKNLLFNKQLQRDPLAYNQAQLAANQAYQDIFTNANKSAELKEMQKNLTTDRIKNPNAYADDFGQRMGTLMNTPISGLSQPHQQYGDLTNWDNYRYQGSNTDFAKIMKDAIGQPKQVYSKETPMDGGLQVKITPYHYANTPGQVKDYLLGAMATHQAGRDAAYQWDHLPEAEIENTIKQYQAIPKERWERMGLSGPQDLLPKNPDNKAENYAAYQAMKYAITNEPKEGTPQFRENKQAVLNWQLNKDKIMEGIRHGNRMAEISFRDELKNRNAGEQDDIMNDLYDNLKTDAIKQTREYKAANGVKTDQYAMKATEGMKKIFAVKDSNGHEIYPDELRFSKDFNTVIPIFLEHAYTQLKNGTQKRTEEVVKDPHPGEAKVDADLSKPLLESEFKERWKKELMGAQAYGTSLKKRQPKQEESKIDVEHLRKKYNY